MAALLAKFRIDYSDVVIIQDIQTKAQERTKKEFDSLVEPFVAKSTHATNDDGTTITQAELFALKERTNRHLRLSEELAKHSQNSTFVVM